MEIGLNFFFLGKIETRPLVTKAEVYKSSASLSVNLSVRLSYPCDEQHPLIE
jgi:hypothetical protein